MAISQRLVLELVGCGRGMRPSSIAADANLAAKGGEVASTQSRALQSQGAMAALEEGALPLSLVL